MTVREAKFDLAKLRAASVEAAKRIALWPAWKREVAQAIIEQVSHRVELNPEWLEIARRSACSYAQIDWFASNCRSHGLDVPSSKTILELANACGATNSDMFSFYIEVQLDSRRRQCKVPA